MTGYYDAVLVSIPVALFGLSGALLAAGVSPTAAAGLGGLVATGLTSHALFVRGPDASVLTATDGQSTEPPTGQPVDQPVDGAD